MEPPTEHSKVILSRRGTCANVHLPLLISFARIQTHRSAPSPRAHQDTGCQLLARGSLSAQWEAGQSCSFLIRRGG